MLFLFNVFHFIYEPIIYFHKSAVVGLNYRKAKSYKIKNPFPDKETGQTSSFEKEINEKNYFFFVLFLGFAEVLSAAAALAAASLAIGTLKGEQLT